MEVNDLRLRTVESLREELFFVPAYQRGYRWTPRQVTELLEDVLEFARSGAKSRGEFYCLQPVVVSRRSDGWEVVDGQQRLTTLHIVLSHFNKRKSEEYREKFFGISYDTRPASAKFLEDIRPDAASQNIDFFHMAQAAATIEEWFKRQPSIVSDCESAFRNNVNVIWYQIADDVRATDVFRRLNVGKIPLSEAELVKALFLRASNFKGEDAKLQQMRQLQIALEWDEIERRLQDDEFWYFLTSDKRSANRIDLLLRLYADFDSPGNALEDPASQALFQEFDRRLRGDDASAWTEWAKVKRMFLTLAEWFEDPTMHHLVGFWASPKKVNAHEAILAVVRLAAEAKSKQDLRLQLRAKILARLLPGRGNGHAGETLHQTISRELADMEYSPGNERILGVLLLFNLVTLMTSGSTARFPFGAYKREDWDIEHIRSVVSRMPQRVDEQKAWLANVVEFFGGAECGDSLVRQADALVHAEKFDGAAFVELFEQLRKQHDPGQDVDVDNSIGNLTLLDAETNRSYGNAMFPLKRQRVMQRDMTGGFVPLCTKNVFLKYYSPNVDRMLMWNKADSQAYAEAIAARLAAFFEEGIEL